MCVLSHTLCGPVCVPVNGYNYHGNFRKKGLINDDDSHHNRKCGVCVYIKGHRLHSTAATPQATIIDRAETRLDQATTILDQKRHC